MLTSLRRMIDPYIVLMLTTVALAAIFPARGSGAVVSGTAADFGIVLLFFLYGSRLPPADAWRGLRQWRLHLVVLASTFVLYPLLGLGLNALIGSLLPPALATGILFLCVLPSTVQSSIAFTSIARGNVPAALCAASTSNILGVFLTPLLASWLIDSHAALLSFSVLRDILTQLLLPFFVGQLLQRWIGPHVRAHKAMLTYVDRGAILLIIYVAFSKGVVDGVWHRIGLGDLALLVCALALLLAVALAITAVVARRLLRFSTQDEIVVQFCGSKKSLASGLPIASVLFAGPQLGLIVLPTMIFHQMQLLVCAVLARRYAARQDG